MSEENAVQRPMLKYAQQVCLEYVSRGQELEMRGGPMAWLRATGLVKERV